MTTNPLDPETGKPKLGRPKKRMAPDVTVSEPAQAAQEELRHTRDLEAANKIVAERLRAGVNTVPTFPIKLRDPNLVCHWFNADKSNDRIYRVKNYGGWTPVRPSQLMDADQVGAFHVSPSGFVVRGERGNEHLMYMHKDHVAEIQRAKTEENNRRMGNPERTKQDLANYMGAEHGAEAGDFAHRKIIGEVVDSRELVPAEEIPEEIRNRM